MARVNLPCVHLGSSIYQYPCTIVIIWDNGASFGFTPFKSEFIYYVKCNIPVKYVTKVNTVIGIGTTIHKFFYANGKDALLPCISYHLPTMDVRLFSPQTYNQIHGANSIIKGFNVKMVPNNHNTAIPLNIQ